MSMRDIYAENHLILGILAERDSNNFKPHVEKFRAHVRSDVLAEFSGVLTEALAATRVREWRGGLKFALSKLSSLSGEVTGDSMPVEPVGTTDVEPLEAEDDRRDRARQEARAMLAGLMPGNTGINFADEVADRILAAADRKLGRFGTTSVSNSTNPQKM